MKNFTNPEVNVVPSSSLVQHGDLPALLVLVEQLGRVVPQVLRDEGLVVAEEVPRHEVAVRSAADGRVEDQRVVVHTVDKYKIITNVRKIRNLLLLNCLI